MIVCVAYVDKVNKENGNWTENAKMGNAKMNRKSNENLNGSFSMRHFELTPAMDC